MFDTVTELKAYILENTEFVDNYQINIDTVEYVTINMCINTMGYTESEYEQFERLCSYYQEVFAGINVKLTYGDEGYEYWNHMQDSNYVVVEVPVSIENERNVVEILDDFYNRISQIVPSFN